MKKTIESRTAEAVLQKSKEIIIGGKTYAVSPPSVATLILASEAISQLPCVDLNSENIASETLYVAKDCRVLGDIMAILILGAKNLKETKTVVKKSLFGLIRTEKKVTVNSKALLSDSILSELSPRQLNKTLIELLESMEISFFFATSTSLIGINLLRQTRETAMTAMTASGR